MIFSGKVRAIIIWIAVILAVLFLALYITFISVNESYIKNNPPPESGEPVTVVVLGCGIKGRSPSNMLKRRLDTAAAYLFNNSSAVAVVSGGVGEGETVSEAEVMKSYLVGSGIEGGRIFLEPVSKNTRQNIEFSKTVIERNSLPDSMVIATDSYHQLRAGMYADMSGAVVAGVLPARAPLFIRMGYEAREMLGLVKVFLQKHALLK